MYERMRSAGGASPLMRVTAEGGAREGCSLVLAGAADDDAAAGPAGRPRTVTKPSGEHRDGAPRLAGCPGQQRRGRLRHVCILQASKGGAFVRGTALMHWQACMLERPRGVAALQCLRWHQQAPFFFTLAVPSKWSRWASKMSNTHRWRFASRKTGASADPCPNGTPARRCCSARTRGSANMPHMHRRTREEGSSMRLMLGSRRCCSRATRHWHRPVGSGPKTCLPTACTTHSWR